HERAFGLLLLLCALPCCIPFLYGVPQIMALPLLALAAQLAAGRDVPWLPGSLRNRKASIAALENVLDRSARYVGWFEKLARPRLLALSDGAGVRVVGALMLIPCASILTPLPATNTTPGIAVAVIAVGLMERDGLMILAGLVLGLLWVALLVFLAATLGLSALGSVREALTGLI
ncbi:MAG: exopolysaccharide biosynthesis protein, partial [Pseudomonadota bacterium]